MVALATVAFFVLRKRGEGGTSRDATFSNPIYDDHPKTQSDDARGGYQDVPAAHVGQDTAAEFGGFGYAGVAATGSPAAYMDVAPGTAAGVDPNGRYMDVNAVASASDFSDEDV